jgi:hypothetical protein
MFDLRDVFQEHNPDVKRELPVDMCILNTPNDMTVLEVFRLNVTLHELCEKEQCHM